jgi:hypothetical protein
MAKKTKKAEKEETYGFVACNKAVPHCIVAREEAYNYIKEFDLKVNYLQELKDGTPRRLWELRDPEGQTCGSLITAIGHDGANNTAEYSKDTFDFMEILIDRRDFADPKTTISPRTSYFIKKESEK